MCSGMSTTNLWIHEGSALGGGGCICKGHVGIIKGYIGAILSFFEVIRIIYGSYRHYVGYRGSI